jgi:dienelactone hydrolase
MRFVVALALLVFAVTAGGAAAYAAGPAPGSPEYVQRDNQNMADAYGRQTAPDGQLSADYLSAMPNSVPEGLNQALRQFQNPTRPIVDPGQWFPGWNSGNWYRIGWSGKRGIEIPVDFTNRYGALLHGHVYAPLPGARDPYTHTRLRPPYPGVVVTTGSIQATDEMYRWLGQDLAERGYIVLTYDVQGQGTSETFPHLASPEADFPYCDPSAAPAEGEDTSCPGVPSQQTANFVYGTEDATDFFESTPVKPYRDTNAGSAQVNDYNPLWKLVDHRPDKKSATPGRTNKLAIIGHSLGASAVSWVQAFDPRVETVVALDKLGSAEQFGSRTAKPVVPGLGIQSEYGFNVEPYWLMGDSSFTGGAPHPDSAPDPKREEATGFNGWRKAGIDSMVIVPRAATHLDYSDINFALPASRYGQDVTSWYVQAWLDKYLKHRRGADRRLLTTRFTYLEPGPHLTWNPVTLYRPERLSFYFCSGLGFHEADGTLVESRDIESVGGC